MSCLLEDYPDALIIPLGMGLLDMSKCVTLPELFNPVSESEKLWEAVHSLNTRMDTLEALNEPVRKKRKCK